MRFKRDVLQRLRKERKLSRRALAELSGVSSQTIWKIESGITASPAIPTVNRLAKALNEPTAIFFDSDTHKSNKPPAA